MKKNTIKAFTLVEMLIVIVIIGILIASLMPRMSAAQGRARDVTRKNDLNQIQTALIAYQGDHGKFPNVATNELKLVSLLDDETPGKEIITAGGFTEVPKDPQNGSTLDSALVKSPKSTAGTNDLNGKYYYKPARRNGVKNEGFVLVAHVEIAGSANYVLTSDSELYKNTSDGGTNDATVLDTAKIKYCKDISFGETPAVDQDTCVYNKENQLVYVLAY